MIMMKIVLFNILSKFEIVPVEETPIPLVLCKASVNPIPEKNIILGFKLRN